jgi:hypothetical protein
LAVIVAKYPIERRQFCDHRIAMKPDLSFGNALPLREETP